MIPFMSLMIGAYIVTRMLIVLLREENVDSRFSAILIKLFAAATILITIACVILIFLPSFETSLNELLQ